jgi:prevent-host-death family protein
MRYHAAVNQVGIRELRANLSGIVRRVRAGETVELTEHGHPVARIVPLRHASRYEQMVGEGRITPPEGSLADLLQRGPESPGPAERPLSEILGELRADER